MGLAPGVSKHSKVPCPEELCRAAVPLPARNSAFTGGWALGGELWEEQLFQSKHPKRSWDIQPPTFSAHRTHLMFQAGKNKHCGMAAFLCCPCCSLPNLTCVHVPSYKYLQHAHIHQQINKIHCLGLLKYIQLHWKNAIDTCIKECFLVHGSALSSAIFCLSLKWIVDKSEIERPVIRFQQSTFTHA